MSRERAELLMELEERGVDLSHVRRGRLPALYDRAQHAELATVLLCEEDAHVRAPAEEAGDQRAHVSDRGGELTGALDDALRDRPAGAADVRERVLAAVLREDLDDVRGKRWRRRARRGRRRRVCGRAGARPRGRERGGSRCVSL